MEPGAHRSTWYYGDSALISKSALSPQFLSPQFARRFTSRCRRWWMRGSEGWGCGEWGQIGFEQERDGFARTGDMLLRVPEQGCGWAWLRSV